MHKYVAAFGYGNKNVGSAVDNFWLDNSFKISADEQIEFLKAFYTGKLPISKLSTDIVKDILVFDEMPAYKLSGKPGAAQSPEGPISILPLMATISAIGSGGARQVSDFPEPPVTSWVYDARAQVGDLMWMKWRYGKSETCRAPKVRDWPPHSRTPDP